MSAPRYAVYFAPEPAHPLWRAGCDWLGRDPARPDGDAPACQHPACQHVTQPRHYGFHATLKAPMRLREGTGPQAFLDDVATLAGSIARFRMPAVAVAWLGDFLSLRPTQPLAPAHPLRRLADCCVQDLDPWRAPLSDEELRRRLEAGPLDATRRALLQRWGYAHVLAHWRFHMTLTDSLPADAVALRERLAQRAKAHFAAALAEPLDCTSLCVFVQRDAGEPFMLSHRFSLAA
jgi:hypothetical protein